MQVVGSQAVVQRYQQIKTHFNPEPIIRFAVRDGFVSSEKIARGAMEGVLQWLAGHAVEKHDLPYVMMNGDVDRMLHAFILNSRMYLHFCRDHVGFFVHHTPLDDATARHDHIMAGIDYTLSYLKQSLKEDLAPSLQEWMEAREANTLQATSVSCMGNGYDDIHSQLLDMKDFATFWDNNAPEPSGRA